MQARLWLREGQFPRESSVYGAPRTILIGEDADSGAVADQIRVIEKIHYRQARFHFAHGRKCKGLLDGAVHLDIEGQVAGIREAAAQPAAVDSIEAEGKSLPV